MTFFTFCNFQSITCEQEKKVRQNHMWTSSTQHWNQLVFRYTKKSISKNATLCYFNYLICFPTWIQWLSVTTVCAARYWLTDFREGLQFLPCVMLQSLFCPRHVIKCQMAAAQQELRFFFLAVSEAVAHKLIVKVSKPRWTMADGWKKLPVVCSTICHKVTSFHFTAVNGENKNVRMNAFSYLRFFNRSLTVQD